MLDQLIVPIPTDGTTRFPMDVVSFIFSFDDLRTRLRLEFNIDSFLGMVVSAAEDGFESPWMNIAMPSLVFVLSFLDVPVDDDRTRTFFDGTLPKPAAHTA